MKTHEFFLVSLPGLEDIVLNELQAWFPELEAKEEYGGITVYAPLETGLSMNLALKTPTRILLRVASFKCRDFPKLYNKVKSLNWSEYLKPETELKAQATARLSRLNMKNRIEKTCLDGYRHFKKDKGFSKAKAKVNLLIRFHKDICTLSLDTSGERLHKRGQRTYVGEAPLRETIAASLILNLANKSSSEKEVEVCDPMMGSGVFLVEAQELQTLVEKRDFNFDSFRIDEVKNPALQTSLPNFVSTTGYELDKKTSEAAKANGVSNVFNQDFFEAQELERTQNARWAFCNPPYGERIKVEGSLKEFYEKIFENTDRVLKPDYACYVLPSKVLKGRFALPKGWKVLEKRPFQNGGIPVTALTFEVI